MIVILVDWLIYSVVAHCNVRGDIIVEIERERGNSLCQRVVILWLRNSGSILSGVVLSSYVTLGVTIRSFSDGGVWWRNCRARI